MITKYILLSGLYFPFGMQTKPMFLAVTFYEEDRENLKLLVRDIVVNCILRRF